MSQKIPYSIQNANGVTVLQLGGIRIQMRYGDAERMAYKLADSVRKQLGFPDSDIETDIKAFPYVAHKACELGADVSELAEALAEALELLTDGDICPKCGEATDEKTAQWCPVCKAVLVLREAEPEPGN